MDLQKWQHIPKTGLQTLPLPLLLQRRAEHSAERRSSALFSSMRGALAGLFFSSSSPLSVATFSDIKCSKSKPSQFTAKCTSSSWRKSRQPFCSSKYQLTVTCSFIYIQYIIYISYINLKWRTNVDKCHESHQVVRLHGSLDVIVVYHESCLQ